MARPSAVPAAAGPHDDLSLAERVCLGLVAVHGVDHGWALGTLLAPAGPLGRIWSLSRPLTYRALDGLVAKGLVARRGRSAGRGRERVLLEPTPAGRRRAAAWLDEPVEHLRDVRTELLVKLWLREQAGLDSRPLLERQEAAFADRIGGLVTARPGDDVVDLWRRESARAVRRFLADALARESHRRWATGTPTRPTAPDVERRPFPMQLSARNQLRASVVHVENGEVMSTVGVALPDGQRITAAITRDGAEDLGLAAGDAVVVVIKSTEVLLAKP